jgi:type I site-specific restriction endonuclease
MHEDQTSGYRKARLKYLDNLPLFFGYESICEVNKKITYKILEDPKTLLSQFRDDYYPRIAVTIDIIATGTDIRPLEVLVFMRDVKSRGYFEQMKGRGTLCLPLFNNITHVESNKRVFLVLNTY